MNKIYRKGVDLQVAFSAGLENSSIAPATPICSKCASRQASFFHRGMKAIARKIYSFLKMPLRLTASRLKMYLLQDLNNQVAVIYKKVNLIEHYSYYPYIASQSINQEPEKRRVNNLFDAVVVVGAGGHAKVCIELLRDMGMSIAYCIGTKNDSNFCLDVSVLKGDEHLVKLRNEGYSKAFIAVGGSKLRLKLADLATQTGYTLVNAISPTAIISKTVKLGQGVAIMAGAVVNAEADIGDLSIINTRASVDHDCRIGVGTHIAPQCAIAGNVQVGKNTLLGVGTRVIPDICIGDDVIIGAGGVVIEDVPNAVMAVGVPVKVIRANVIKEQVDK